MRSLLPCLVPAVRPAGSGTGNGCTATIGEGARRKAAEIVLAALKEFKLVAKDLRN